MFAEFPNLLGSDLGRHGDRENNQHFQTIHLLHPNDLVVNRPFNEEQPSEWKAT